MRIKATYEVEVVERDEVERRMLELNVWFVGPRTRPALPLPVDEVDEVALERVRRAEGWKACCGIGWL